MGLFCIPVERTVKELCESAIANLRLFEKEGYDPRLNYLITFAQTQLDQAMNLSTAEV